MQARCSRGSWGRDEADLFPTCGASGAGRRTSILHVSLVRPDVTHGEDCQQQACSLAGRAGDSGLFLAAPGKSARGVHGKWNYTIHPCIES